MATWTAATAIATGNLITSSWMSNTVNAVNFLGAAGGSTVAKDLFFARQGSVQSIGAGAVFTPITFAGEDFDAANGHSTSSNQSRYVVQAAGKYRLMGGVAVAGTVTDNVTVGYLKSLGGTGTSSLISQAAQNVGVVAGASNTIIYAPTILVSLAAGDYVELATYRGLNGFSTVISGVQSYFGVEWVGA